jgi:hypothetical protein
MRIWRQKPTFFCRQIVQKKVGFWRPILITLSKNAMSHLSCSIGAKGGKNTQKRYE